MIQGEVSDIIRLVEFLTASSRADVAAKLDSIERKLDAVAATTNQTRVETMGYKEEFANLEAQVTETVQLEQSAISLFTVLSQKIADAAGDPAAVVALATQLKTSAVALAAAIVANTPAAPVTEPEPRLTPVPPPPASEPSGPTGSDPMPEDGPTGQ